MHWTESLPIASSVVPASLDCHLLWLLLLSAAMLGVSTALAAANETPASTPARPEISIEKVEKLVATAARRPHPRLFVDAEGVETIKGRIEGDATLQAVHDRIVAEADAMLDIEPIRYEKEGRRLLHVSRTALRRTLTLSYAYRMTGKKEYAARGEKEMLAAAAFEDWNPSHFLDTAEMTAALAIGYDWLHDALPAESRKTIRDAIVAKGLKVSIEQQGWWARGTNNWNPVCNGGLSLGALAVMEDHPKLASEIVALAANGVPTALALYGPRGAYPEGPMYWEYGTSFTVLLIDALETALGDDLGLADHKGLMASANYYLHAHGPTGRYFNYSDCGEWGGVAPAVAWFARRLEQPGLMWVQKRELGKLLDREVRPEGANQRMLPLMLVWSPPLEKLQPPRQLHYHDSGETPVGMHRTGWGREATFVGLKGGSPYRNHSHMDIGSFVLAADGVRWAVDLGSQSYHSLESVGVKLWDYSQDSDRWKVYRWSNLSHNTLVVNGKPQLVAGKAEIVKFADEGDRPHTVIDMASVYEGQLAAARRGVALLGQRGVVVQDEIEAGKEAAEVRWAMVTRAEVSLEGSRATLSQEGKSLRVSVLEPAGAKLEVLSTKGPADSDAANPSTRMLAFGVKVPAGTRQRLVVWFEPLGEAKATAAEAADKAAPAVVPLEKW